MGRRKYRETGLEGRKAEEDNGDDANQANDNKRIRKKRKVGRKCRGLCWKDPPLPQSLLQQDAKERTERRKAKVKAKLKEKKKIKREDNGAKRKKATENGAQVDASQVIEAVEEDARIEEFAHVGDLQEGLVAMETYLKAMGHTSPTRIQQLCWPQCLEGRDVQAKAEPGTGKTFAYMFPVLYSLSLRNTQDILTPRALVLVPTRELAKQILATCRDLKHLTKQKGFAVTGGLMKEDQIEKLKSKNDVAIATPGRLCDLLDMNYIELSQVRILVIDEADKMLQMGFEDQLQKVHDKMLSSRRSTPGGGSSFKLQTLLFSATFPQDLMSKCKTWLKNEQRIDLEAALPTVSQNITQRVHVCAEHKKGNKLMKYIKVVVAEAKENGTRQAPRILVFVNTIKKARFLFGFLKKNEFQALMIHGKRSQLERNSAIQDFKSGKVSILVATDIASRGIHIPNLKHVVLYDFPPSIEQYVHRIGRTGRQSESGEAFTFFTRNFTSLAPSLVDILKEHSQIVDPNLQALADASVEAKAKLLKEQKQSSK